MEDLYRLVKNNRNMSYILSEECGENLLDVRGVWGEFVSTQRCVRSVGKTRQMSEECVKTQYPQRSEDVQGVGGNSFAHLRVRNVGETHQMSKECR